MSNATGSFYSKDGGTPQLVSFTPANNSAGVSPTTNITYTFSESVTKGSGNIFIKRGSDNTTVETIPVTSAQVTGSGTNWTIDPSVTLAPSTQYYVTSQSGTWKNVSNIVFPGVTLSTTQRFTTHTVVNSVGVPANNTYITGENLDFTVNLSGIATVNIGGGVPTIPITIGSTVRNAAFLSGSGTNALIFRYIVVAGDFDNDGITVGSAIALNGGTIIDAVGANVLLTLNSIGNTNGVLVNAISQPGAALNFDGVDDHVDIANSTSLNSYLTSGEITIEYWLNPGSNTTGNRDIISKRESNNTGGFVFEAANGSLTYQHYIHTSGGYIWADATYTANTWQHIAVVAKQGDAIRVYKNGVLQNTTSLAGVTFTASTTGIRLMAANASNTFFQNGSLDELRIWKRALCQAEIVNNMNCEIPTTGNGLVANYHFNQGVAGGNNTGVTTLTDASSNANNGTLNNFALAGATSNWVAPGGVTSGVSCNAYLAPEINVQGNSITITDGDITPSAADHTDFGSVNTGGNLQRTFTIQNTGTSNLDVSSITMSGADAGLFSIGALTPASPVAPNGSATFTVTFAPTSPGLKTATVNIASNDCDEATYDFAVQGTGASVITYYPRTSLLLLPT